MNPQYQKNTQRSYYSLARVFFLFPFIMIGGTFLGKKLEQQFQLDGPIYFFLAVLVVSLIGWLYIAYEYKRIKAAWKSSSDIPSDTSSS